MFRITETPGKVKGAIASQAIPAGTLIQSEKPIIKIPRYTFQEQDPKSILAQLQPLSAEQKRQFFDLKNNFPGMRPIEGITKTNAIPLGHSSLTGSIFLNCSRFNHSCTANAAYHWNDNCEEERIYSVRDISADEEITVNYLPDKLWALPGKERRAQILAEFGFNCGCVRCMNSHEEPDSDRRRKRLAEIERAIGHGILIVSNPGKALAMCREALDLFQKEEEAGPRLVPVYYDASKSAYAMVILNGQGLLQLLPLRSRKHGRAMTPQA